MEPKRTQVTITVNVPETDEFPIETTTGYQLMVTSPRYVIVVTQPHEWRGQLEGYEGSITEFMVDQIEDQPYYHILGWDREQHTISVDVGSEKGAWFLLGFIVTQAQIVGADIGLA